MLLSRSPWQRVVALFIIALIPVLAIAVPLWCFGSGTW